MTARGAFGILVLSGGSDVDGDGALDITFDDVAGSSYWTVNGVEVVQTSSLVPTLEGAGSPSISTEDLIPVVEAATNIWASMELSASQLAALATVQYEVRDLSQYGVLGLAGSRSILIGWR